MTDFNSGYIEIHFYTEDGSHTMDAEVLNKCIYEYLGVIKEITSKFQVQVEIEAEALEEGGIRQWLKINLPNKDEFKKEFIMTLLIGAITYPFSAPFYSIVDHCAEHCIEQIFTPKDIRLLEDEKRKAELEYQIEWYKNETRKLADTINTNMVAKKKSNFYTSAKTCSKVNRIEFTGTNEQKISYQQIEIQRGEFDNFILLSDELEPKVISNAEIEIVSPVLKKGKYKWTGIYNGEVIQFALKSNEFKTLVQTGQIAFKNGSSIVGELVIYSKLDTEGNAKVTGYEVWSVDATIENAMPMETPEGRRKRRKKEGEEKQLSLDF